MSGAPRQREAAVAIIERLRASGHEAYLAGGCVRDELLGLTPGDYDVATSAPPAKVVSLFRRCDEVGASFGVVLVREKSESVEVATFRTDGVYTDRRRPDRVTFASAVEDAQRRDFTVNAMFLDPLGSPAEPAYLPFGGRVIDYVGGLADLHARVLRAVGEPTARLAEDPLRALRAVRLASRLGLSIEPGTARAITAHAQDLGGVSRERIGDELRRMLAHPSRAQAAALLGALGLDAPALGEPHARVEAWRCLGALPAEVGTPLALAALALDRGHPPEDAPALLARWRSALCLSNAERDELGAILRTLGALGVKWGTLPVAGQKRLAASCGFAGALTLLEVLDPTAAGEVRRRADELAATRAGLAPEPLVTGDDLITLGLSPGPGFRGLLDRLYDEQLEGELDDRSRALDRARALAGGEQTGRS